MKTNLRMLIFTALMTALVFITTSIIKIPIPFTNGYIHAGDMCVFLSGVLLGPFYGAFAAGVGSAFADFFGGYVHWVLPTLLIKGVMGLIVGYFSKEHGKQKHLMFGILGLWPLVLIGFLITIKNTSLTYILQNVEEAGSLEEAANLVAGLSPQLIGVAISVPLITYIFYLLNKKYAVQFNYVIGMILAGVWMVLGYYLAAGFMYGSFIAPIFSIPWNIIQFVGGAILAFFVISGLSKTSFNLKTLKS